jgi:uncharacterized lipoprotein YbaY
MKWLALCLVLLGCAAPAPQPAAPAPSTAPAAPAAKARPASSVEEIGSLRNARVALPRGADRPPLP